MSLLLNTLTQHAQHFPERIALQDEHTIIHYAQLLDKVTEKAADLHESRCNVVGIALDNGVDWMLWDLACVMA